MNFGFNIYMSSKSTECQPVEGTEVTEEWFGFLATNQSTDGTLDRPLSFIYDNNVANLSYCFYKSYERTECLQATDTGASYRGRLNVTFRGLPCLYWNEISGIDSSNILEENYCRKLDDKRDNMLSCYAVINKQQRRLNCGPKFCFSLDGIRSEDRITYMYTAFQNVAYHRPVSTNVKSANLEGLVNGLNWRGSAENVAAFLVSGTYQPWIRVDLGARYLVHAVILYRKKKFCDYPVKWSNIAVWIHDYRSQFDSFGGQLCWEIEDLLNECNIEMRCVQALSGYYVTVQTYASASLEYIQPTDTKTAFEEIEIYGEATGCGQYFGIGSGNIALYQVDVHREPMQATKLYQLNDRKGQCFQTELIVNIDLLTLTTVEGFALNFNADTNIDVTIRHDRHKIVNESEEEVLNFKAVVGSSERLTVKYLRTRIFARMIEVRFKPFTPEKEVCLTYDLIGCPKMILRDPFCSNKHSVIGMGVVGIKAIRSLTVLKDVKVRTNSSAGNARDCELKCLENDNCITWSFKLTGIQCKLYTTTYLLQYSGQRSPLDLFGSGLNGVAGERLCIEGIFPAYPCRFETDLYSPMYIASPSYPAPYSTNLRCTWKVNFPHDRVAAVKITFLDLQFPTPKRKKSAYEMDTCVDFLSVGDREKSHMYEPHIILTYENASSFVKSVTYLDEEPYLLINFVSCGRKNVWEPAVFSMKVEKSECVGCRNFLSTCNNPKFDSSHVCIGINCGYISTLNYLGPYGNNMVCRWVYSSLYPVKIDFVHFDIPGGDRCKSDNLTLYTGFIDGLDDFTDKSLWEVNGVYCNTRRPQTVIYMKTDFGLEFSTDDSIAGTGFLLRWRRLKYEIKSFYRPVSIESDGLMVLDVNGVNTSGKETFFKDIKTSFHFCERKKFLYELYVEYPVKCYLTESFFQNEPISWKQANRKCKGYGGKLVTIKNKQEDDLIRSILELTNANHSFIGLQRNHSTGQLYDEDKKKYLYTNWGFDDSAMSMEPNGLEESNCIMMKDLHMSTGSSLTSSWADVNCNQKYVALVVCEQPIYIPWDVSPDENTEDFRIERNSMLMTLSNFFRCDNGQYILSELQCDMNNDCHDSSDELECESSVCGANKLYCGDSEPRCIHINLTCDFYYDCRSGVDEIECVFPACEESEWRCLNGQCIPKSSQNDGVADCIDKSDEMKEGSKWLIEIQTSDINDGGVASDVFIKVYSEKGSSQYIHLDRNIYRFDTGSTMSTETVIDVEDPTKIRVRHEIAGDESSWYLDKITMRSEERGTFIFECSCAIPDPTTPWIPFRDISVNNRQTELPLLELTTYSIEVRTGLIEGSGTLNKVYISLYGDKSDTGIFELTQTADVKQQHFQSGNVDIFSHKTVDIGNVDMIKVYHFGSHLHDDWFLNRIIIRNSFTTVYFKLESWIGVNMFDSDIGISLLASGKNKPSYDLERSCPNQFQCLDSQCIPKRFYCDQVVHCRGPFHEDEPLVCSPRHLKSSCLDVLAFSNSLENYYKISFENGAQFYHIHCAFGEDEHNGTVVSKVHSNIEHWINITGELDQPVSYDINDNGIELLKRNTEFCIQRIETQCLYSNGDEFYPAIELQDWNNVSYRPFLEKTFSCGRKLGCNCRKEIKEWYPMRYVEYGTDEILITDNTRLPIRKLGFLLGHLQQWTYYGIRLHPLECFESLPKGKRFICNNGIRYDPKFHCLLEYDVYGSPNACRDFTHVTDCESFECPAGYVKCRSGFCIPLHYVCNGVSDCIQSEDEMNCNEQNICVGALRCRKSPICVAADSICDGKSDCPLADDELRCGNTTDVIRSLTIMDATSLDEYDFSNYIFLATLNLSSVGINTIKTNLFRGLTNLLVLDISKNDIKALEKDAFGSMSRLEKLNVDGNTHLQRINPGTFNGLSVLEELELKNMEISKVLADTFDGLNSLKSLNLSNNLISSLQGMAFSGLPNLKILDLRGNKIVDFSSDVFAGLDSLENLISDLYLLCCLRPSTVPEHQCFPGKNEFSSCDDLMKNEGLRVFVWIIGTSALLGNAFAMIYRISVEKTGFKTGNGILLTNLCIADCLMGVYMIIIGSADANFRGTYVWNDIIWRGGIMCKLAGFISFLSNEVSGAILCLITFDRYVTIRFTFQRVGFTRKSVFIACLVCWAGFALLALVPLVGLQYFDEEFYTKSGVCLAHPLTTDRRGGWEYATAIFVFLNFFMFIFIAVGQVLIFREIHNARRAMNVTQNRHDVAIARKLSLVVMTNFLCWFPVCIMGLIAMSGFVIDSEVYAWVAVFVLPLNSAVNPIMYTLSSLFTSDTGRKFKSKLQPKKKTKLTEDEQIEKLQRLYDRGVITLCNQPSVRTLARHLDESKMKPVEMMAVTKRLAEAVHFIHNLGFVIGPFTCKEVVLEVNKHDEVCHVSFLAMPIYSDTIDDVSNDIGNLGLVIKRMLKNADRAIRGKQRPHESFRDKMFKHFGASDSEEI